MKKLITFFLCLSIALCFGGPIQSRHAAVIGKKGAGGGGPTYLIDTGFEAADVESGWGQVSTPEWDYTGTVITGSESFRVNATGESAYVNLAAQSEIYFKMRFRIVGSVPTVFFLRLSDAGQSPQMSVAALSGGALYVDVAQDASTVSTIAADTTYYLWGHYLKGTGANAVGEVWFSATNSKPADGSNGHAKVTTGGATGNIEYVFLNLSATADVIYDEVQFAATAIP